MNKQKQPEEKQVRNIAKNLSIAAVVIGSGAYASYTFRSEIENLIKESGVSEEALAEIYNKISSGISRETATEVYNRITSAIQNSGTITLETLDTIISSVVDKERLDAIYQTITDKIQNSDMTEIKTQEASVNVTEVSRNETVELSNNGTALNTTEEAEEVLVDDELTTKAFVEMMNNNRTLGTSTEIPTYLEPQKLSFEDHQIPEFTGMVPFGYKFPSADQDTSSFIPNGNQVLGGMATTAMGVVAYRFLKHYLKGSNKEQTPEANKETTTNNIMETKTEITTININFADLLSGVQKAFAGRKTAGVALPGSGEKVIADYLKTQGVEIALDNEVLKNIASSDKKVTEENLQALLNAIGCQTKDQAEELVKQQKAAEEARKAEELVKQQKAAEEARKAEELAKQQEAETKRLAGRLALDALKESYGNSKTLEDFKKNLKTAVCFAKTDDKTIEKGFAAIQNICGGTWSDDKIKSLKESSDFYNAFKALFTLVYNYTIGLIRGQVRSTMQDKKDYLALDPSLEVSKGTDWKTQITKSLESVYKTLL
jgi:hypothetical protein